MQNDGTLGEADISKILRYYGLAVPAILCEGYAVLRQQKLSEKERNAATWLGATTGLFDDFFDKRELEDHYIENLYLNPDIFSGNNDNERLFNRCWKTALQQAVSENLLKEYATKVHEAQILSRQQVNHTLDTEFIKKITFDKGGYSVLFYMSLFYTRMPDADYNLFYGMGALLQLENDLFDVYKDHQDHITTLATGGMKIASLRHLYLELWMRTKQCLTETSFSSAGKKHFLKILCGLVSRGLVCLDMLQQRENENNGSFDPAVFTRKQLICDMEKPVNLLRTMHYYASIL